MREIKYRGKRIDDGEWVYGNLIGNDVIVGKIVEWDDEYFCTEFWLKVDPETVGEYTGLKDRNGKEVYEWDIIKCTRGCPHTVEWVKEYAGMYGGGMPAFYLTGLNEGYAWTGYEEVIGNIHQNPELLTKED